MNHYTLEEVAKQRTWIVIHSNVYDIEGYLTQNLHPGGNDILYEHIGLDATKIFTETHSPAAWYELEPYRIGRLKSRWTSQLSDTFNDIYNNIRTSWFKKILL